MSTMFSNAFNNLPPDEREAFYRTVFLQMDSPSAAELRRQYYATVLRHMGAKVRIGCGVKIENPQFVTLEDNVTLSQARRNSHDRP